MSKRIRPDQWISSLLILDEIIAVFFVIILLVNFLISDKKWQYVQKSKIHRAKVTGADLNYSGSITIDEAWMQKADLVEFEKVQVLDIKMSSESLLLA